MKKRVIKLIENNDHNLETKESAESGNKAEQLKKRALFILAEIM